MAAKHAKLAAALCGMLPAACVPAPSLQRLAAPSPAFDPIRFFAGTTHGEGRLHIAFKRVVATHVDGSGHVERDGALVLDQTVIEGDKPARRREWRISRIAPGRYRGTLTDATGPVAGEADGNRLRLAYTMKCGLSVEQLLYLTPDGHAAHNRLTVRKFGLVIAALNEMIDKR